MHGQLFLTFTDYVLRAHYAFTIVVSHQIGDRLLTDVVFGNMHGMFTVLVAPLSHFKDHPVASLIRLFELYGLLPIIKFFYSRKK